MDKKKFREFIESVAEIKDVKPLTDPKIRLDENSGGEVRYEDEWINIGKSVNPTLGFKFVKLKTTSRPCSLGCGDLVKNQVVEKKLHTYPNLHWRTNCKSCGHTVSPDGQGFIKGTGAIQAAFYRWYIKNKE